MPAVHRLQRRLTTDSRGAAAVEYGLIASLIVMALVIAVTQTGTSVAQRWSGVDNQLAAPGAAQPD